VGAFCQNDLTFGDTAFGSYPLPGREYGTEDGFGASTAEKAGHTVRAMQQIGCPADHFGLNLAEGRKSLGIERILVQIEPGVPAPPLDLEPVLLVDSVKRPLH